MATMKNTEPIYFDSVDLNSITGWLTTSTVSYRHPQRVVSRFGLVNNDNAIVDSAYYNGSTVTIEGIITADGRENLDSSISELKELLEPINVDLELMISGERRKYIETTMTNIVISDVNGGYAKISIEFATKENVSRSISATSLYSVANLTSGDVSYPVIFAGTAKQLPVITITFDSGTPTANRTITVENPATGKTISVQTGWTATDVLIIDCDNKTVTQNGIETVYQGNFLEWASGAGHINFSDDFTTRQIDIAISYTKRWL